MVEKDVKAKGYRFDDDTLEILERVRVYLTKQYGIDTNTGAIKYLIRKGDQLAKENKL